MLHSFFLSHGFVPLGFPGKVFNEATFSNGHPRGSVMKYYLMDVHA